MSEYASIESLNLDESLLRDGMYDVTGITYLFLENAEMWKISDSDSQAIREFKAIHGAENVRVAAPYETFGIYLFAGTPRKLSRDNATGSCGRGSNLLVSNCPKEILIICKND